MLSLLCIFASVLFVQIIRAQQTQSSDELIYLTLSNGTDPSVSVAIVVSSKDTTPDSISFENGSNLAMDMDYDMSAVDHQITPQLVNDKLTQYSANLGNSIEYSINEQKINVAPLPPGNDSSLTVCIFGDYSANLYYNKNGMDLGSVIDSNNCNLNLFMGRLNWELSKSTGLFSFNPYVTFFQKNSAGPGKLAEVPSIVGQTGHGLRETTSFQSVEVNGVAFIQITVEVFTVAKLTPGSKQQKMVQAYFRETMYNELECKLKELYERENRPWIIVYMTHPYEINQHTMPEHVLTVNDTDRLFEIARRYRIDLLTSCGAEGMGVILAQKLREDANARLPAYLQTTMVPCAGYRASNPTLQSECSYALLQFNGDQLRYLKKSFEQVNGGLGAGDTQKGIISDTTVIKTKDKPEPCVEDDDTSFDEATTPAADVQNLVSAKFQ